jgi:hypothetical protein
VEEGGRIMPIKQVVLEVEYVVSCDYCGKVRIGFETSDEAIRLAIRSGWQVIEKLGQPLDFICPDCQIRGIQRSNALKGEEA